MNEKGNPWALLPLGLFLILFVGSGIITGDFYAMPVLVAFLLASIAAFMFNRNERFNDKVAVFCKGAGKYRNFQQIKCQLQEVMDEGGDL